MSKKIQAIILAGGKGSRLRPYTTVLPKPLMPVDEYPIAEIIIRQLKTSGIENIVISTGHLAGLIESYFGKGKKWGVNIKYVRESKPLGTAGAIKCVQKLEDNFLVINGDILTDMNFKELLKTHKSNKSLATIAIKERKVKTDFGVIEHDQHGNLIDYIEKPEHKSYVSMGVNMFHKRCKKYIQKDEYIGIPELILRMRHAKEKIKCFQTKALWLDLGRLDDFNSAQDVFVKYKHKFLL